MSQNRYSTGQTAENGRPICGAKKKNGDPCGASPKKGYTRCHRHGGAAPGAKRAAKRRNSETAAREILGTIDPDAPREHPVETLLNLIQMQSAEVNYYRQIVKEHDEKQLMWTKTEHQEGLGPMGAVDMTTHRAEPSPWLNEYNAAKDRLAKYTSAAARAGVEDRAISLAEQHAEKIVTALNRVFAQLQLNSEQQRLIPEIVPTVLRELSAKDAA